MTRTTRRYLIGFAAVVGVFVAFLVEERVRGHLALGAWERELRARGEQLTIAELAPPITNAAVRVLTPGQFRAMLVESTVEEPWVDRQQLPAGREAVLWRLTEWRARDGATNNWGTFAAEFQGARERLAVLRAELTNGPMAIQLPYEQGFNLLMPHLASLKGTVQSLRRGTLLALHEHQLDEVVDNLRAAAALIELQRDEALVISQLVRIAVAEISLGGMLWQALQAEGWNDAQLASIQAAWEQPRFLPAMARALAMERAVAERYYQGGAGSAQELAGALGVSGPLGGNALDNATVHSLKEWVGPVLEAGAGFRRLVFLRLWQFAWAEQDQRFHHQAVQRVVEAARAASVARNLAGLRRPGSDGEATTFGVAQPFDPQKLSARSRAKHWLSLMLLGPMDGMLAKAAQMDCRRELSIAAVALKRHQVRHGEWPPRLEALVPDFLPEVPRDWMDGAPLRYRRNSDGTFTLYSVGMDGQDDGGNPEPRQGTARSVFQGRDWVWAQPVSAVELEAARRRGPGTLPRYPYRPVP